MQCLVSNIGPPNAIYAVLFFIILILSFLYFVFSASTIGMCYGSAGALFENNCIFPLVYRVYRLARKTPRYKGWKSFVNIYKQQQQQIKFYFTLLLLFASVSARTFHSYALFPLCFVPSKYRFDSAPTFRYWRGFARNEFCDFAFSESHESIHIHTHTHFTVRFSCECISAFSYSSRLAPAPRLHTKNIQTDWFAFSLFPKKEYTWNRNTRRPICN